MSSENIENRVSAYLSYQRLASAVKVYLDHSIPLIVGRPGGKDSIMNILDAIYAALRDRSATNGEVLAALNLYVLQMTEDYKNDLIKENNLQ